jgi:hypothetical protein
MAHDHTDQHHGNGHVFKVRVQRQDDPHSGSYWETFNVQYEDGMNMTTVMQRIAAHPITDDNKPTRRLLLPGGGLRGLHDGDQRQGAAGVLGLG